MIRLLGVAFVAALLAGCSASSDVAVTAPLTGCTVSISPLGQTAETVAVRTAPGARVALAVNYAQLSTQGVPASAEGVVIFHLPIADAPAGVAAPVIATASLRGVQKTCSTSFTPTT